MANNKQRSLFPDLSTGEKLALVEELWDEIAASADDIPIHEWQQNALDTRKQNNANHSTSRLSWDEVKRLISKSKE